MSNSEVEIWKDVVGYEGIYQVSNIGGLRSVERIIRKRGGSTGLLRSKILSPSTSNGYFTKMVRQNGIRKLLIVHRAVAMAFIPNPENKPQVNHMDLNRKNNNVSNLEWVTCAENLIHSRSVRPWNWERGQPNKRWRQAKLSIAQVRQIRKAKLKGVKTGFLAEKYKVTKCAIWEIATGRTWSNIA